MKADHDADASDTRQLTEQMEAVEQPVGDSFDDAWIGLEPTLQTRECVTLFTELENDEERYFSHPHMVETVRKAGAAMAARYREGKKKQESWALFDDVTDVEDQDDWELTAHKLTFSLQGAPEPFQVVFGMDPATFEMSLRPLPLAWLYDERFVGFLDEIVFQAPQKLGLSASLLNGGGQFHISAKTMLTGSLLCDDVAHRLSHPELSTFIHDFPNCDGRSFRATDKRYAAFVDVIDRYRQGAYHPGSVGVPTVESAYFDLWPRTPVLEPDAHKELVGKDGGPVGDARAVFQTNFVFGRAVKEAQRVHPGYWQLQHPGEHGYRPDQIMRYSETNLARLQIIGELHVKKDVPLSEDEAFDLDAPLAPRMLFPGASYELRAQMSKQGARDTVDAVLLEVHHWRWLRQNPKVAVRRTLLQDQLLKDAEHTLHTRAPAVLSALKKKARVENRDGSMGRVRSAFVEPETLFWAAWHALDDGGRAGIAREAVLGFIERVGNAASVDPRRADSKIAALDPMEPHRHRIHPILWDALTHDAEARRDTDLVGRELRAFQKDAPLYLSRRPQWSQVETEIPPWEKR